MTAPRSPDARYRILYIDDDRPLRDLLLVGADPICFHLDVAEGTPAAERLLHRAHFDLVVCGTIPTMLALNELATSVRTRVVAMAVEPFMIGGRGSFLVVPRPKTAPDLRDALFELLRDVREEQAAANT
jgi:hypothetical protein